jgi:hypothetical protein
VPHGQQTLQVTRNVDFVDFLGVFPSVGREKIDIKLFDGNGSFLGELLGGDEGAALPSAPPFFWCIAFTEFSERTT